MPNSNNNNRRRVGIYRYAGPAVEMANLLRHVNHSPIADEELVRKQFSEMEADLAEDHRAFFASLEERLTEGR